jgi:hypothetical protein
MGEFRFSKGLHELGNGAWAWLQPDGSWGWSNAGLVTDGGEALLVDTLFDLRLTAEMLAAMRASVPAAARIGTLVTRTRTGPLLRNLRSRARASSTRARAPRRWTSSRPRPWRA